MMIKAVVFDMDGVLIDATDWHFHALNQALSLFGLEIEYEEHLSQFNGLPTKSKLKILSDMIKNDMAMLEKEIHKEFNRTK